MNLCFNVEVKFEIKQNQGTLINVRSVCKTKIKQTGLWVQTMTTFLGFLSAERMGRLEIKLAQISVPVVNWNNVPHLFSTSKK